MISNKRVSWIYNHRPRKWPYTLLMILMILSVILWSYFRTMINSDIKDEISWSSLASLGKGMLNPNLEYLFGYGAFGGENFETSVLYLMLQTIAIAFIGTLVGSVLALPFGFLASKNICKRGSFVGEVILIIIRTFPEILLALVLVKGFGTGALTGTIVIGIHSVGMIGKLYAESIENMDVGSLEALDAVGANLTKKIKFGIFPQVTPEFISTILYRFDINVRSASVLGVVSAGGIGAPLMFASMNQHWSDLASILYAIIFTVIIVDLLSNYLRKKLI